MKYSDDRSRLSVEIQTEQCDIPVDERARLQTLLAPLGEAVKDFPASDLGIKVIHHPRARVYHVKCKLRLPGRTLFIGEVDPYLDSALQRGLSRLVQEAEAYRADPDRRAVKLAERRAALDRGVVAPQDADAGPLADAVGRGDYWTFRTSLAGYEEWLRKRVGRWVQRVPEADARVGDGLLLGDLVEDVYLNAFERFGQRPTDVPLSEWLDGLIAPSLQALLRHPDEERENASLARTVREAPLG